MKVVILAGGRGKRMGHLTDNVPKPMLNIIDKPILAYQIKLAKKYNLRDFVILTGYQSESIEKYFHDGEEWGVNITYHRDKIPLGTAGAVKEISRLLEEDFLVFYGDIFMDVDLRALVNFHLTRKPIVTITTHPNDHPYDSDLVEIDEKGMVIDFHSKPHNETRYYRNIVNAALYVMSPEILQFIPNGVFSDFGKDIFPKVVASGRPIYSYNTPEYIKDIGTIERLMEVEKDVVTGKVDRLNRRNKRKAIFLDRDGVLNEEVNFLKAPDELHLLPQVSEAVRKINKSDFLSVIVTNQPIIAKGFATIEILNEIHAKLETLIGCKGAYIDKIYYCPHHPEKGFLGERPAYKIDCDCRKPMTGMIEKAVTELNIDITNSFLVGDRTVDIKTGVNAGLKTVLVKTGYAGEDGQFQCEPDFIFENLKEAVDFITDDYRLLYEQANYLTTKFLKRKIEKTNPVIIISGLSRSGKSTFARILTIFLEKIGITAKILKLDNWILGTNDRKACMSVRGRYKYDELISDLHELFNGKTIWVDQYDIKTRTISNHKTSFSICENEYLIIDEVIGLDIEYLREIADLKIFIDIREDLRKERFYNFYKYKGLSEEEIERLYVERQNDETPVVLQNKKHADYIIDAEAIKK